ncbi:MAG: adenosine deaminase [Saprospiraceae bacterium]|nr:adenosine deaminase [Saprospiraceae bacterium]
MLEKMPKVELHLHLDCSLSYPLVQQFAPGITQADYLERFVAPPKCHDLADYISRASMQLQLMQTKSALRLSVLDIFQQLAADEVIYAEIRFAPLLHLEEGLSAHEVVHCVNEAVNEGMEATDVEGRLILCTLRHYSEEQSMQTVQLVKEFRGSNVVGFDIAADEAGFPINAHIKAFAYAKQEGLHVTAHAGEARGSDSVWETLEHFQPSRIGHGVRSIEDPNLIEHLRKHKIHLEVCPTSNVQTNVVESLMAHPVDQLLHAGVSVGINTDARTISNVTLADEYAALHRHFGWTAKHLLHCNLEAIRHAFVDEKTKDQLQNRLESGFAEFIQ